MFHSVAQTDVPAVGRTIKCPTRSSWWCTCSWKAYREQLCVCSTDERAGCQSFCVEQAFPGRWVNPAGGGVINNPADMWSGWWFEASERACLNQCTALWYLWYQSSGGSGGMQPLFLVNHNASGNVRPGIVLSLNTGHYNLVLASSPLSLYTFLNFSSSQLTIKSSITFCTKLQPILTHFFSWLRALTALANSHTTFACIHAYKYS